MSGRIVVAFAVAVVILILGAGISTLWVGGEFASKWSNRLMRYRVVAQFVAICIIMLVLYVSSKH